MLNGYEFGFVLRENGEYRACVKEIGTRTGFLGWLFNSPCTYTIHDDFIEAVAGRYCYHLGKVYFNSVKVPDCSKFACHVVDGVIDTSGYVGYSIHEQKDGMYHVRRWLSVEEYKDFVVKAVNESLERNKDLIANEKLYKEKGSVFVRCK